MSGPLTSATADNSQGIRIRQWLLKAGLIRYWVWTALPGCRVVTRTVRTRVYGTGCHVLF
jgi:hypothetical protein